MYFLFVSKELKPKYVEAGASQKNFRDAGIGGTLLERIAAEAEARGAKKLYISAANGQVRRRLPERGRSVGLGFGNSCLDSLEFGCAKVAPRVARSSVAQREVLTAAARVQF